MSVALTWSAAGRLYELERRVQWNNKKESPIATSQLRIDGGNPEPTAAIPEHVQRFLAKDIAHFVFFNGEVQQEFDEMASNSGSAEFVRREIEKTLSIPVIKEAVEWLGTRAGEESQAIVKANKDNAKVAAAQKKKMDAQDVVGKLQEEYNAALFRRNDARYERQRIEDRMQDLEAIQDLASDRAVLKGDIENLKKVEGDCLDRASDLLSQNPWLPVGPALIARRKSLMERLEEARTAGFRSAQFRAELSLLEALVLQQECPICQSKHAEPPKGIEERIRDTQLAIESMSDDDVSSIERELALIADVGVDEQKYVAARTAQKNLDAASANLAKRQQRFADILEQLTLHGGVDVQDLMTSFRARSAQESDQQEAMQRYKNDIDEKEREIRKYENDIGKAKGVSPEQRKTLMAYEYLQSMFSEALDVYTREVKNQVQQYASATFMEMISDRKYEGLRINENFGVDLMMTDGQPDPLRSTGQGKIATIALVSGLIKTAMAEGSILMDTPFVSLDEGHRREVGKWAYDSGLNVSLFMHSGEFKEDEHMEFFDGHVGRLYRIRQIDVNESTIEEYR